MNARIESRLARLERAVGETRTPVTLEETAEKVLREAGYPPCPLVDRWLAGDRSVAPIIAIMGPGLIASVSEVELEL